MDFPLIKTGMDGAAKQQAARADAIDDLPEAGRMPVRYEPVECLEQGNGQACAFDLMAGGELEGGGDWFQFGGETGGVDVEPDAKDHERPLWGDKGFGQNAGCFFAMQMDVIRPFDESGQGGGAVDGLTDGEGGDAGEPGPEIDGDVGAQQDGEKQVFPGLRLPAVVTPAAPVGLFFGKNHQAVGIALVAEVADMIAGGGQAGVNLNVMTDGVPGEGGGDVSAAQHGINEE